MREKYIKFGIPQEKIIYSANGINTKMIAQSIRYPSKKLVFGYMGTFMETKGLHILIDAFVNIPQDKAELRVYGYPPNQFHLEYCKSIQEKAKVAPNITFMGKYDINDIPDMLAHIDTLVVPSIWYENAPLTIHEAFMSGVPVIASDIGGMAELVKHGVSGLSFRVGDSEDLHRKIMMLIENPKMIGELSAKIPSIKTVEKNAEELEKIYKDLIANAQAG